MSPLLLCTDLDRTLLPNGAAPESPGARALFARLVRRPEVRLVYVTGRDRGRVERAIDTYDLPRPHLVVADVGTTIYDLRDGRWTRSIQWDDAIAADWAPQDHPALAAVLRDLDALSVQEPSRQGRFKLSYHVALGIDQPALDGVIAQRLTALGVRAARVWSIDEEAAVRLLDLVPACATKEHAVRFVGELLGISLADTVFAGDSGNDLPVLVSDIPAVLVANARPAVVAAVLQGADAAGTRDALYLAQGGWRGMNGCYAAGILEGLAHYHPGRVAAWLGDAVHP